MYRMRGGWSWGVILGPLALVGAMVLVMHWITGRWPS